ncbi:MAG: SDR family oxidoreductase [Saprospiraceae bacterium]
MNIVITGATKGIGKAIAIRFAKEGYDLAVCARNADDLRDFEIEVQSINPKLKVITLVTDISQKDEVLAFTDEIGKRFDKVDILVNNGGVFLPGTVTEEDEGKLEMMIETNLYSAYHLTRALLPLIRKSDQGHIFNMCSVASLIAYPNGGSYSISKFALLGFTKVLREELKTSGIKVTAIMPGATWSDSWSGVDLPVERLMQATDIAESVWSASQLSKSAVVEEIILRPQLGDL